MNDKWILSPWMVLSPQIFSVFLRFISNSKAGSLEESMANWTVLNFNIKVGPL